MAQRPGGAKRILATVALAAAALAFAAAETEAASRACRQIEAQLAGSSSGGGSAKKYEKAISAQEAQLGKARAQMREASCGLSFLGMGKERCVPMRATIQRMESNLAALQRKMAQMSGGKPSRAERARLLAALDANGCRDEQVASRETATRRVGRAGDGRSLFDQLFGGQIRPREEFLEEGRQRVVLRPGSDEGMYGGGQYRTLCVRTCDGYYFPMSGASSSSDFERDQKNCEAMCPGTEVKLFYHQAATEESEAMVSVADGKPYTEIPNAFQYRNTDIPRDAMCGCNPQKNYSIIAGEVPMSEPVEPVVPQPVARPDPAADPETLANADGGLTVDAIRKMLKPAAVADDQQTASTAPVRIRVVGPVFLPDPEGAIDLRAPGQKKLQ